MKKKSLIIFLALSLFILMIANINCGGSGGGGSVKSKTGTTTVTITIGGAKTVSEAEGGKVTKTQIPIYVTAIRYLIQAQDMDDIQRVTPVNGQTSITESFEVPNGDNRHITVEALNSAGNVLYAAERDINLHGQHTTIDMYPENESVPPVFNGLETVGSVTLTSLVLSWQPATDNVTPPEHIQYLIYMSRTSGQDFNTPTYTTPLGATSYTVTGLSPNTTYYFVVRAMDEVGNIAGAKELSATTERAITAIDVDKSCTAAVVGGQTINFSAIVTNNGNEPLINITCSDDHTDTLTGVPASLSPGQTATITGSYIPESSPSTNTLTCRGTGEDSETAVEHSDYATCTIAELGVPTLLSPIDATCIPTGSDVPEPIGLDWYDVVGATSYNVQVCYNVTCTEVIETHNVSTSNLTVTLDPYSTYYWHVRAYNSFGSGPWSDTWSFTLSYDCYL